MHTESHLHVSDVVQELGKIADILKCYTHLHVGVCVGGEGGGVKKEQ